MKVSCFVFILTILHFVYCNRQISEEEHERMKRYIFLKGSGIGYIIALAIPTSLAFQQRVYLAFNFEAHYGVIDSDTILNKLNRTWPGENSNINEVKRDVENYVMNKRMKQFANENNLYTRKNFYRLIERHIDSYGLNGTACLLRAICETAETPLYEYNGVFGNVFHILFTPSSSRSEKIKSIYYDAEYYGQQMECKRYYKNCDKSFVDFVSEMMSVTIT